MIEKLQIKNFQSHKDTEIEFHSGVNSIIGETDSGKSSVLRTINWIVNNRPVGDGFRSHFAKSENTSGTLIIDGQTLSRIKGNKDNQYALGGHYYKAIGTSEIPKDIKDFLNMSEINIQKQMDAPFLLSETPGEVGRFLNQIVNIENIDASLKRIDSSIRKNKSEMTFNISELEKSEEELKKTEWIIEAVKEFEAIRRQDDAVNELSWDIDGIKNAIDKLEKIEIIDYDIQKAEKEFNEIQKQIIIRDSGAEEYKDIIHLTTKIYEAQSRIIYDAKEASEMLLEIEAKNSQVKYYIKNIAGIDLKISEFENEDSLVFRMKVDIKSCKERLNKIMPEQCPLCGQEISHEKS